MTTQTANQNKKYCEVCPNIHPKVVAAVKEMVKGGFWKKTVSNQDKAILMGAFVQKVSRIYKMDAPKFYYVTGAEANVQYRNTGGGCYFPDLNEMYMFKKPSLMTFLHEFRHAMQYQMPNCKLYKGNKEEDARAWSHSLYKTALPNSYKKAIEQGLFHHE